jgi:hypothetical protein
MSGNIIDRLFDRSAAPSLRPASYSVRPVPIASAKTATASELVSFALNFFNMLFFSMAILLGGKSL